MVRIIAPACPYCSAVMGVVEVYAMFAGESRIEPVELNLAQWYVGLKCVTCGETLSKRINDCKAPLREPAV